MRVRKNRSPDAEEVEDDDEEIGSWTDEVLQDEDDEDGADSAAAAGIIVGVLVLIVVAVGARAGARRGRASTRVEEYAAGPRLLQRDAEAGSNADGQRGDAPGPGSGPDRAVPRGASRADGRAATEHPLRGAAHHREGRHRGRRDHLIRAHPRRSVT